MSDRPATRPPRSRSPSFPPRGSRRPTRRSPRRRRRSRPGAPWPPPIARRLLRRLAALVEEHGEELALLETRNVGKPIADSRGEVGMVADVFHFYAGAVDKHHGETIPVAGGVDLTFREPLGVVGLIMPWNFPLAIASWKLGPALACGNTVVLKPAELTPLTARAPRRARARGGHPRGCASTSSPARAPSSGRGSSSTPTSRRSASRARPRSARGVMKGAADTIKRVTLELGGKSANVVFADGDLEARRRRGAVRGLRERGPGLLRPLAHPRRAERVRPLPRAPGRGDEGRQRRRPRERRDRDGPARLVGAARDGLVLRRR